MDGFTPGRSGGCCEIGGSACESCAVWWEHYYSNHLSDDQKQFLLVASGDFRHSMVHMAATLAVFSWFVFSLPVLLTTTKQNCGFVVIVDKPDLIGYDPLEYNDLALVDF